MAKEFPRFADLRKARQSVDHSRYFVTLCTRGRSRILCDPPVATAISEAWKEFHGNTDATTLCAIIMPDHIHWLFSLGTRLSLHRVVAKFKALTRADLAKADARWEDNFWEHRLRPDDAQEGYAQYIFMNPYRARLICTEAPWPHWWCPETNRFQFTGRLRPGGLPPPAWVGEIRKPAALEPGRPVTRAGVGLPP